MEGELKNIIKVWVSVFASLTYCYLIARCIPKGKFRLMSLIPIFYLFLLLPLNFSSFLLRGFTGFSLAWLANFKLLLFAFGQGPLSLDPSMSLVQFIVITSLPIKTRHHYPRSNNTTKENPSPLPTRKVPKSLLLYAIKVTVVAIIIRLYDYKRYIHPHILRCLHCSHIYFVVEVSLNMATHLAGLILGLELEPTFKEPHLSTSLQDFWSRRWNLPVSKILYLTVYEPTRYLAVHLLGNESKSMPTLLAILNTFFVSGLMHELLFFYIIGCWEPTWKNMIYFSLHGVCLAAEVAAKKALAGRWQLHPAVSWPLVLGFVFVTFCWTLLSVIIRHELDSKAIIEYNGLVGFIKNVGGYGIY